MKKLLLILILCATTIFASPLGKDSTWYIANKELTEISYKHSLKINANNTIVMIDPARKDAVGTIRLYIKETGVYALTIPSISPFPIFFVQEDGEFVMKILNGANKHVFNLVKSTRPKGNIKAVD
jgi:hypothetical protein